MACKGNVPTECASLLACPLFTIGSVCVCRFPRAPQSRLGSNRLRRTVPYNAVVALPLSLHEIGERIKGGFYRSLSAVRWARCMRDIPWHGRMGGHPLAPSYPSPVRTADQPSRSRYA